MCLRPLVTKGTALNTMLNPSNLSLPPGAEKPCITGLLGPLTEEVCESALKAGVFIRG